jgi:hypothetical protein
MGDISSGLGSNPRVQTVVLSWFVPLLAVAFAFVILILPEVHSSSTVREIDDARTNLGVGRTLFIASLTFTVATVGYVYRLLLYRILEGIAWPRAVADWRVRRAQQPQRDFLVAQRDFLRAERQLERARAALESGRKDDPYFAPFKEDVDAAKTRMDNADTARQRRGRSESVTWYWKVWYRRARPLLTPRKGRRSDDEWLPVYPKGTTMPTRVGNALKSLETYAVTTFGFDSQSMWYDLYGLAPQAVREAIDDAELQADAFVSAIYAIAGFTAAAVAGAAWRDASGLGGVRLWITAGLAALLLPALHRGLLASIAEWASAIRTMVNIGRVPLRSLYELPTPSSAADEREMWSAVMGTLFAADPLPGYWPAKLEAYRRRYRVERRANPTRNPEP